MIRIFYNCLPEMEELEEVEKISRKFGIGSYEQLKIFGMIYLTNYKDAILNNDNKRAKTAIECFIETIQEAVKAKEKNC